MFFFILETFGSRTNQESILVHQRMGQHTVFNNLWAVHVSYTLHFSYWSNDCSLCKYWLWTMESCEHPCFNESWKVSKNYGNIQVLRSNYTCRDLISFSITSLLSMILTNNIWLLICSYWLYWISIEWFTENNPHELQLSSKWV